MANFDEDDHDDADFTEPISEIPEKTKLEAIENGDEVDLDIKDE